MLHRLPLILLLLLFYSCETEPAGPLYPDRSVEIEPADAARIAAELSTTVSPQLAEGLDLSLWATDSLVKDPIAISVAPDGRVFYTRANRQRSSEFDIRGHRDWMTASLSFQTPEDRRAFLREHFSADSEPSQLFLKDLNEDGVLDWRDLAVEKEQVWFVTDRDGDQVADRTQLYLEDFNEEITDVANGVEFHNGEVYISVGPDLWRTKDTDADGRADLRESISHGYAVHVGFSGHGMSGVTVGPRGRIWWGIGDIGMNVVDKEGKNWKYPNRGVVVSSEPDGSDFEVFAMGVRNTHEFAFDEYGNLITVDNDGDHRGERERLVYLINGSDTGWRINWQFGKYTDPTNNDYKVWMDEKLHIPRWDGQAAYILPTIQNFVNGPTGLVYNPGTALSPEYYDHFFVAEFRGSPANSPLHAFSLKDDGAGFALDTSRELVRGLLPTGVDFAADGSLFFADWINGWGVKDGGRIWRLDVTEGAEMELRRSTQEVLTSDFTAMEESRLGELLGHQDQRVRKNAQFELVDRGDTGYDVLRNAAASGSNQMARIHGLWGMAQAARAEKEKSGDLAAFLGDSDPEIIAQAAKLIGEVRFAGAAGELKKLLSRPEPRVRFFAMEALGRTEEASAIDPILELVRENNDEDTWLRAGAMIALGRIGESEPLTALSSDPSKAVRTAAVVALRRMEDPGIAVFLADSDEYVAAEAARGINDDFSIEAALPDLAAVIKDTSRRNEALLRRAINANSRVGESENIEWLAEYATRASAPEILRAEALSALSVWGRPSVFDRVDGRYRGEVVRDSMPAARVVSSIIEPLLKEEDGLVALEAIKAAGRLGLTTSIPLLRDKLRSTRDAITAITTLTALNELNAPELASDLEFALASNFPDLRARALEILPSSSIAGEQAVTLYGEVLEDGSLAEQQAALAGLGMSKGGEVMELLGNILDRLVAGEIDPELELDVIEAAEMHPDAASFSEKLDAYAAANELGLFNSTLSGGNARNGQRIFYRNQAAQCVRCHAVFEYGGNVGPGLADIGEQLSPEQLLEALIRPSARLAPGYETVILTLSDEEMIAGTVLSREDGIMRLQIGSEEVRDLSIDQIMEEETVPSSMPSVEDKLSKREIRDLLAFLTGLKGEET